MAFNLGDLVGGAMKGYSFVRQIKLDEEDRATEKQMRARQIALEDEDRQIAREELGEKRKDRMTAREILAEKRQREATRWNWEAEDRPLDVQQKRAAMDEAQFASKERRYDFGRKVKEGEREDEARIEVQDAYGAAKKAYEAAPEYKPGYTASVLVDPKAQQKAIAQSKAKTAKDFTYFYMTEALPRVQESMMRRGDIEGATALEEWAKTKATQKNLETYGRLVEAVSIRNENEVLDLAAELYNDDNYYPDGLSVDRKASKIKRDNDGKSIGFTIAFKNDETGETWTQDFDNEADMYHLLLGTLDPATRAKEQLEQMRAGQTAAADRAKVEHEYGLKNENEIVKGMVDRLGKDPNKPMQDRLSEAAKILAESDPVGQKYPDAASLNKAAAELLRLQDEQIAALGARSPQRRIMGVPMPGDGAAAAPASPPVWRP